MHAFAVLALVGAVAAKPMAAGVTSAISPKVTDPAGCSSSYSSEFEISIVNISATASKKRSTALEVTLSNGVLTDAEGRTGYIASNYQFQFDKPPQAGAIYTSGWSACSNGTLALGASAVFYECLSGTFYNLYDESTGAQCSEVLIDIVNVDTTSTASSGSVTSSVAVSQISDGQVQATTAVVSQISDGQIQATTATAAVVSQISDGQIQATTATAAVVSQISDGQIQATTGKAVTTSSAVVVSQISDGQIQATTGKAVTTSSAVVVSQISDGQIQATKTNGTVTSVSATAVAYTGAAVLPSIRAEIFGLAAGVLALAAL